MGGTGPALLRERVARLDAPLTGPHWSPSIPAPPTGVVHLDWSAATADVDAVDVTARAVAAAQGLRLRTPAGPTAPAFWDVESTRWLRWCFTAVRPHDVTLDCP